MTHAEPTIELDNCPCPQCGNDDVETEWEWDEERGAWVCVSCGYAQ